MKKVILITGASSGMGKQTALDLIDQGYIVYGAARSLDKMKDIQDKGGHVIQLDITDEKNCASCIQQIIAEQGKIDILWNNAGYGQYGAVENVSLEEARHQFEVNIFGLAAITKEVLPHMRARTSGLIINTSSMGGKIYMPLGSWYHATKHALEGWSDCLRLELKQFGIDVVILEPGAIQTEFGSVVLENMLQKSKRSPYDAMTKKVSTMIKRSYGPDSTHTPVSVISQTISKIIQAKKPKTRYLVGKYAKSMVWIRKILGDRVFDAIVMYLAK